MPAAMAVYAVYRNTFLDFVELSDGNEAATGLPSTSGLKRANSAPAAPPGRRIPNGERTLVSQCMAALWQVECINEPLQAGGQILTVDEASAAAGKVAAIGFFRWPNKGEPLASSIQSPSDAELLTLRSKLGLATRTAERVSTLKPSGSQGTLAPPDAVSQCNESPASCRSGTAMADLCKGSGAEIYTQLKEGLKKLLAVEASERGQLVDAGSQANQMPMRRGMTQSHPFTTVVIRNVPYGYKAYELQRELEGFGFPGAIDFVYVAASKDSMFNAGCAFVSFVSCACATRALHVLDGYSFKQHRGPHEMVASTSMARIQGLDANIRHRSEALRKARRAKWLSRRARSAALAPAASGERR